LTPLQLVRNGVFLNTALCFLHVFLSLLLTPFIFLFSKTRNRWFFEQKFKESWRQGIGAKSVLHCSSEGELEQLMMVIHFLLSKGQKVVLFYTSESLGPKMDKWRDQICEEELILLPFPVLSFWTYSGVWKKIFKQAKYLVMVRYDFFPPFLHAAASSKVKSILLLASLKNKNLDFSMNSWWWKNILNSFDVIIPSAKEQKEKIEELIVDRAEVTFPYDFRIPRILQRMNEISFEKERWFQSLNTLFDTTSIEKRIIFGSTWEVDLLTLENKDLVAEIKNGQWLLVIAPHKLKGKERDLIEFRLNEIFGEYFTLDRDQPFDTEAWRANPSPILSLVPGVLCEMYTYFGQAYIGGGFGRSVHSLLEPYCGSCNLYCGPRTHRSTEYDLIMGEGPDALRVLKSESEFYNHLITNNERPLKARKENLEKSGSRSKELLNSLFGEKEC
jgi:3-deoxy-D-manno-octulosonic-acid transferase